MSWEWSHSVEAYENAKRNLEKLDEDTLHIIAVEWFAYEFARGSDTPSKYDFDKAQEIVDNSRNLDFCEFIWEKMEQLALCDNGGWNAWACPFGCHTVSFS